jgi:solute carrier family 25 carnitine/acylcarnitine transporter 20/29
MSVIKSKLQTDFFPSSIPGAPQPQYRSMADCFRQVWAKQGLKGFTNGLGPTLIRSPFANGATFVGFEIMMRALE